MKESILSLDSREEAVLLFGSRDQFLREIRQSLGIQIIGRGEQVLLKGTEEQVDRAEKLFVQLRVDLRRHGSLSMEQVRASLDVVGGHAERVLNLDSDGPTVPTQTPGPLRAVRARTEGQSRYLNSLRDKEMVICVGPAGTGKTWLAVAMAVSLLRSGQVKKIVLVRPAVEARHGKDPAAWQWGSEHRIAFFSLLRPGGPKRDAFGYGERAMSGSGETIMRARTAFQGEAVEFFASMRFVADLGDSDRVQSVLSGGAVDRQFHPHQKDQLPAWTDGQLLDWWLSPQRIDSNAKATQVLRPR